MQRRIQWMVAGLVVAVGASGLFGQAGAIPPATAPSSPWVRMTTQTTQVGVSSTVQLLNMEDGTTVLFRDSGDNLYIQYQAPKTLDFWDYTVAAKELRHGELAPYAKEAFPVRVKAQIAANGWEASAARWKVLLAGNWQEVAPVDEDGMQCYKLAEKMSVLQQSLRPGMPLSLVPDTVWVDPGSKMIRKTVKHFNVRDKEWDVTVTYDYNVEAMDDVYAAGVPRDARIVDNRPSAEAREVLDRLDKHVAKGMGDYVGVHVDAPLRLDGTAEYPRSIVRLLARKGNSGLASTYSVVSKVGSNRFGVILPENWDSVDLPELIATMRASMPNTYAWYADGKGELGRFMRGRFDTYSTPQGDYWTAVLAVNIGSLVWPDTNLFNRYTPETQVKLLSDEAHKGQLGLQVTKFGPSNDYYLAQYIYWLDPERSDVVLSSEATTFRAGSGLNRLEVTERRTLEIKTMDDGRVYPARWQVVTRRTTGEGFLDPQLSRESRLLLMPAKELDSTWLPRTLSERSMP